jgi:hypothetical protein
MTASPRPAIPAAPKQQRIGSPKSSFPPAVSGRQSKTTNEQQPYDILYSIYTMRKSRTFMGFSHIGGQLICVLEQRPPRSLEPFQAKRASLGAIK